MCGNFHYVLLTLCRCFLPLLLFSFCSLGSLPLSSLPDHHSLISLLYYQWFFKSSGPGEQCAVFQCFPHSSYPFHTGTGRFSLNASCSFLIILEDDSLLYCTEKNHLEKRYVPPLPTQINILGFSGYNLFQPLLVVSSTRKKTKVSQKNELINIFVNI